MATAVVSRFDGCAGTRRAPVSVVYGLSETAEFDRRLRRGIPDKEIEQLQDVLDRLAANIGTQVDHGLPGPGLLPSR